MSKQNTLLEVARLIEEQGFWEAAKSYILQNCNESERMDLIVFGTELMMYRFSKTKYYNSI